MSKKKRTIQARAADVLRTAESAAKSAGNWIELHNALFGIGGAATLEFTTDADRTAFAKTDEFRRIMDLVESAKADEPVGLADLAARSNGNISLRLPKSIHAALLAEAQSEGVSLNQLCLAKLCTQLRATL